MRERAFGWFAIRGLMASSRRFQPPTEQEILNAIGIKVAKASTLSTQREKKYLLRFKELYAANENPCPSIKYLEPVTGHFESIPLPDESDWLANHHEAGQTFEDFVKRSCVQYPRDGNGTIIAIQPFGDIDSNFLQPLQEYASLFFALTVKVLPAIPLSEHLTTRFHFGNKQYLTKDLIRELAKKKTSNMFCILGITMEDIYPEESWNFVFGIADVLNRRGVYSMARYNESFYETAGTRAASTDPRSLPQQQQLMFYRRCFKVMTHEIGHMFGLRHCIYFNCLMNGSNHLAESDRRPLHECPVCLRKLHYSIRFDIGARYRALRNFHLTQSIGAAEEAEWLEKRLAYAEGADAAL